MNKHADTFKYDFLVVGAGLYGSVIASDLRDRGLSVAVAERRSHIGGSAYTENEDGITVHKYGPHIFHTDNEEVWRYVNRFAAFRSFINRPAAVYKGEMYSLPFNMKTFEKMWGVTDPGEAGRIIRAQSAAACPEGTEPRNLEEQAKSMVGTDIYEKLVKGYSEKQWGRSCSELPPYFIKRLPVRFDYNDSYFNDKYQGIPIGGYNRLTDVMLKDTDTITGIDFLHCARTWDPTSRTYHLTAPGIDTRCHRIVFTGCIDEYFNYQLGPLEYRTVRFEHTTLPCPNHQGNAVVNYTSHEQPFTRIIEHKHFEMFGQTVYDCPKTVVSEEYSTEYKEGMEPYYPVNDDRNNVLAEEYRKLAAQEKDVIFGGRLAQYKYYDMAPVIEQVLEMEHV